MTLSQGRDGLTSATSGSLASDATALYNDSRLMPMLRQLIRTTCRLGDAVGGSVSLVDGAAGLYTKVAEVGTACRLGQSFPISEGVTGAVLDRRGPVVLRSYREVGRGHLTAGHPAWDGAVAAIPIWWRADIVAVNVIFAGVARGFSVGEIDDLEFVTQVVAPGLITAVERELPEHAPGRRRGASEPDHPAPIPGDAGAAVESVNTIVANLISLTQRATGTRDIASSGLELKVLGDPDRPRLIFRPDTGDGCSAESAAASWQELIDDPAGVMATPPQPGLSVSLLPSPLTAREQQVAVLLGQGLGDRAIASDLCLSPKTVEKHVSAVLRKTGTTSRTAAVLRCLDKHWM